MTDPVRRRVTQSESLSVSFVIVSEWLIQTLTDSVRVSFRATHSLSYTVSVTRSLGCLQTFTHSELHSYS